MNHADKPPEPVSDLEKEGIPDMEGSFPGEAATGVTWDGLVAPGDEPKGAEDFGITPAEERLGEPLSQRVLREVPDDAGAGETTLDDISAARRLVGPEIGSLDDEGDMLADLVGYDPSALAPEEAAVHVVDEADAAGLSWDESPDYVGGEAPGGGAHDPPR